MNFNPGDYVQRASAADRFPDGVADIIYCRYCGRPLFMPPGTDADCGMHLN
jgi:hypothetical protein